MSDLTDKPLTDSLRGKTLEEVKQLHTKVRVMREDGVGKCGTCDFKPERVNLHLENGKVVNAYYG